ncbi:Cmx/CmrA family chloramphenicol efflux MFS transporter [Saccharomonospora sp. NPDC006951]
MPLTVYVLGLSVFALGTSEFMLAGLLPAIAADLGVSIPDAGLLISAFAVGMLAGAPLLAMATHRLPRRTTLLVMLAVFAASHALGALAPGYAVLFASRVLAALACAGFWAAAASTTIGIVAAGRRGRALAIITGGLTAATVAGVPLGTALGQHAGWRMAFWAVGGAALVAMAAVAAFVRPADNPGHREPLTTELRVYRRPALWLALGITALSTAAITVCFSYLSPLFTDSIGGQATAVPWVLALYGAGALAGITTGGKYADAHPIGTITGGALIVVAALTVLATAPPAPVALVTITVLGFGGFAVNPAVNARVFTLAESAPSLAGASNTSAFNAGIVVAPWLGGLTINAGFGYLSVTWLGIGLAALTLAATGWAALIQRRTALPAPVAA